MLDPRGPLAHEAVSLMWLMVALGSTVFAVFAALLVAGATRRRDEADPRSVVRRWLVVGGVVLPSIIITVVFGFTLGAMRGSALKPGDLEVEVVGHQWWWELRYPDFTTANEIHLPAGEPVTMRVVSDDVIHSVWVPDLGAKIDLLPDFANTIVLEADEAGRYRGACAEFCGLQHARMRLEVVALPRAEYDVWAAAQVEAAPDPTTGLTRRGREVFTAEGCGECHTVRGTNATGTAGPDLTHFASRETLAAATLPNDDRQLADWIRSPQEHKEGVSMPPSEMSEADMEALVAYLRSLE